MKSRIRPCDACGGRIGPDFYVVRVAQALVDYDTVNRLQGMTTYFQGHQALAEMFMPDQTLEHVVDGEDPEGWGEVVLCQNCFFGYPVLVRAWEKTGGG
jgi:hypothetical protein